MEGGKQRDEERRKAGKGKEGKKESHEGFDTQVRNISKILFYSVKIQVFTFSSVPYQKYPFYCCFF